ncbi:hypothetical protein HDV00_008123 [Rhizophlyctis rosea]|nr:hypothetical protein HDV00_008123 [Rhizophlyctis rosea]
MEEEDDYDSGSSHDEDESRYGEPPRKRERRDDSESKSEFQSMAGSGEASRNSTPKRTRASRACDQCRKRRTKCSGKTPCDSCITLEIPCTYVPVEKKRGPLPQTQQVQAMEKRLRTMEMLLNALLPEGTAKALQVVEEAQMKGIRQIEGLLATRAPVLRETRRRSIDDNRRPDSDRVSPTKQSTSPVESAPPDKGKADESQEGFLIVRNRNVSFYGKTSTSSNADLLDDSPAFRGRIMTVPGKDVPFRGIETIPCPQPLIEHLSQAFFHHVHPFFPMIDAASYFPQLRNRTSHTASFTFLHMMEFRKALLDCARGFIPWQLDSPSLQTVQAMIVMSLCSVNEDGVNSWTYVGIAIRMAQELGLHRNLDRYRFKIPATPEAKSEMRRTWFCCYGDWDTPAPELIDLHAKNLMLHVGVARVFGDICILTNSADPDDRETLYANAHARLLKFRSSLPDDYQLSRKPITVFGNFLHIAYHTATILLHRVVHGRFDATCFDSAHDILESVDALPDPPTNSEEPYFSYHMIPYGLMTSTSLFINEVLVRRNYSAIHHIRRAMYMMQKLGHASVMARGCFQLNDELLAAKRIDWRNGEVRAPTPAPGGGMNPNTAASLMAWRMITAGGTNGRDSGMAGGFGPHVPGIGVTSSPVQQQPGGGVSQAPTSFPAAHPGVMPWIAGTNNVDQYSILSDIFTPFWEGVIGGADAGGGAGGVGGVVGGAPTPPVGVGGIVNQGGW